MQTAIPFLFMRGGTSRGPYLRRDDLPHDEESLSKVLVHMLGSGHPLNIDGIGGGAAVTTKVAMLSVSEDSWADVDYFFAQVSVEDQLVDYKPTCGNILSAVGPAAVEMGMVKAKEGSTRIKILAVNTGARVIAEVLTPGAQIAYHGDMAIDGVPGTAAPIELQFLDVVGGLTGSLLPTGNCIDTIQGVQVSCMDVAMPVVLARGSEFGLTGHETAEELDANRDFFDRMEAVRLEAGELMGMGDVKESVTPKFAILSEPRQGGAISARYFMPWKCHPSMAVTGAQCIASCLLTPGSVADGLAMLPAGIPAKMVLEHPLGAIDVIVDYQMDENTFNLKSAGLIRTARKLAQGEVFVPDTVWTGK